MKIFNSKVLAASAAVLTAALASYGDLVWTKEGGWRVEGGVLESVIGDPASAKNALEAMNKAKAAQDGGENWTAIEYYRLVSREYPQSIFAPEAYFQLGILYRAEGMFEDSFESFETVIKNYPDYPKFNLVISEEYKLAQTIQDGATPYLWGWMPWFTDYNEAIRYYEAVVSNAPYSDFAPMALMNIAIIADREDKPEIAIDALDRLINTYPQSMFTPDAYLQMAVTYRNMVDGPEYDQGAVLKAIDFYQDFLILFPSDSGAAAAESGLELMRDVHARSRLIMGDFYYYYRNNFKAASIFYNETITAAPDSLASGEAERMLKRISDGILAPMTPVDWFFGRYERPDFNVFEDQTKDIELNAEKFEIKSADAFLSTPGAEASETFDSGGSLIDEEEALAPIFGPEVENAINGEGFFDAQ